MNRIIYKNSKLSDIKLAAEHHQVMAIIGKPKPVKQAKVKRVPVEKHRRKLEKQIEAMAKAIIFWRDGQVCVMGKMDGGRCGNGLMWNHFIAQGQSSWMRLDIGNIFCGCGSHNLLDKFGDPILGMWVQDTFGIKAVMALRDEAKAHANGKKRMVHELEELLAHYDDLYQNRYTAELTIEGLVSSGFYGSIIREAWVKEGRI